MLIITFGWLVLLPHEEPHPWWPDGEWLPWVGPGLLARPDPLPGCRGRVWWPGLMALDLPTSIFLGTRYQGGGVHMDGCLPTANKKRGPQAMFRASPQFESGYHLWVRFLLDLGPIVKYFRKMFV